MSAFVLHPGSLTREDLRALKEGNTTLELDPACWPAVEAAMRIVLELAEGEEMVYGINTGFGSLARTRIPPDDVRELQRRLVLSHSIGTGPLLPDDVVRMVLALKINILGRGHSGCRRVLIDTLREMFNAGVLPCIPAKGSVGASGDLVPLAHTAATLIGLGEVRVGGDVLPAAEGLRRAGIEALELGPKEGLAMLNGTQVSSALALCGLFAAQDVFAAALVAGAMSVDAAQGADAPFSAPIQEISGRRGQIAVAGVLRELLEGSAIIASHVGCDHVQDPYSLRCQPQVMGACLESIDHAAEVLGREINAVSDNPLVFAETGEILSGGNFHAQSVAMAADVLALALAEIGTISERRVAILTNPNMSGLPAFLVSQPGLNSGFMSAHIAAAAIASENKVYAHPASIDSIPTVADQEDHVSMATFAARRLSEMAANTTTVVAIELLAAAQGIDLRRPLETSPRLQEAHAAIRERSAFLETDRPLKSDLEAVCGLIRSGWFRALAKVER